MARVLAEGVIRIAAGIDSDVRSAAAGEEVIAGSANQDIVAAIAFERVMAVAAGEDIRDIVAFEGIGAIAPDQIFNIADRVPDVPVNLLLVGDFKIDGRSIIEAQRVDPSASIDELR